MKTVVLCCTRKYAPSQVEATRNEDSTISAYCNIQGNIHRMSVQTLVLLFKWFPGSVAHYINSVKDINVIKGLHCMSMLYQ